MKIYDPFKNKFVDLHSIQGVQLLKKYVKNYQNGGSGATAITTHMDSGGGGGGSKPQEAGMPKYGSCEGYNSQEQLNCEKDIVVVFLGGFHPFHRGHFLSYFNAKQTFGRNVCFYVVASNSKPKRKTGNKSSAGVRPFPFEAKKKLAIFSGVKPEEILCDKSPMKLFDTIREVHAEIADKLLIIVRSKKEEEDELITSYNTAKEKLIIKISDIAKNPKYNLTESEIASLIGEYNDKYPSVTTTTTTDRPKVYYRISGTGLEKKIVYDEYQPIPDECYEYENEKIKFKFNHESIDLLNSIKDSIPSTNDATTDDDYDVEAQIRQDSKPISGFVHITNTHNDIAVDGKDLSSGTKIREAYINARSPAEKKQIISILYPDTKIHEREHILNIYDEYLNNTFFENYKSINKARQTKRNNTSKAGKGGGGTKSSPKKP